ncbi:hypothetical protein AciX8_0651 [Granulicella mallensis MP5ACTX8]|uniref:Uncharacterized protein n=1 Tax=Granulicella mallensis (strain ATCC BAA-1857 / DSM 23137 / MP5ACTX8) TaxID=682795 RepID=G8NR16_GRAMM|nr:hypothetical protein AciX8_0651 [Granulicella mallensis MP5ACTX8]
MPEALPGCDTLSRGGFDEVRLLLIGVARSTASSWSGVSSNLLNSFALSLWVCDIPLLCLQLETSLLISHSHAFAAGKSGVWNTVGYSKRKRERTAARHENGEISFVPGSTEIAHGKSDSPGISACQSCRQNLQKLFIVFLLHEPKYRLASARCLFIILLTDSPS